MPKSLSYVAGTRPRPGGAVLAPARPGLAPHGGRAPSRRESCVRRGGFRGHAFRGRGARRGAVQARVTLLAVAGLLVALWLPSPSVGQPPAAGNPSGAPAGVTGTGADGSR